MYQRTDCKHQRTQLQSPTKNTPVKTLFFNNLNYTKQKTRQYA
ncbi:hypothetical protein T190607A02C_130031 [Tenacibaculum sp. 190524A02b]